MHPEAERQSHIRCLGQGDPMGPAAPGASRPPPARQRCPSMVVGRGRRRPPGIPRFT